MRRRRERIRLGREVVAFESATSTRRLARRAQTTRRTMETARNKPLLVVVLSLLFLLQQRHPSSSSSSTASSLLCQVEAFTNLHNLPNVASTRLASRRFKVKSGPTFSTCTAATHHRTTTTTTTTATATLSILQARSRPQDLEISFGSQKENQNQTGGVSWGDGDAEDEDEEMRQRREEQAVVQSLLEQDEDSYQQERKRNQWGDLVKNVSNTDDLQQALQAQKDAWQETFQAKAKLAKERGVELELLAPPEEGPSAAQFLWSDENDNIQIKAGSGLDDTANDVMDQDLAEEWKALTENDDATQLRLQDHLENILEDVVQQKQQDGNKKWVPRDTLQGVRVGSAGGWTLEVFPGDFVVHRKYGIGRFERTCLRSKSKLTPEEKEAQSQRRAQILTQKLRELQAETGRGVTPDEIQEIRSVFGTEEDTDPISNPQTTVLEIAYLDAVVHVPVDRAYRLSRYRAGDAAVHPKLSRVRGESWRKAKEKVQAGTLELAQDVLALYATRETLARPPFDPQCEAQVKEFETSFPFEPTPDQKKCFEDVENDMVWRSRPMDRLVCGDVGFGKTEVALRAVFRCVANGRQAALLAPTGVLAAQHFKNAVARMGPGSPWDLNVGLLRGGMGPNTRVGRELRQQIADGTVQIIVGTQSLLSNELKFHDLGLLVIDEEQRFGVKQKEKLKLICSGVDVLTLSATPIPRTLQMSLSGIRDTSTIRSPPPMRKPTITYVQEFSEALVQKAIQDEVDRGGQCYYVVPRISMLTEAEELIQRLFPDIRLVQAHGRMNRNGAEENVAAFAEGHYDVLLATTVIENGVDIPTVNTIIVQNSQAFGMSTLYQLRGRVGRSDQQAYAYIFHRPESITEQAVLRLQAIGELNELGSGFDVANRDLEIRGAGSLLGTEQSGVAARVGFDLYMRMLKKSIRKLRGLDLPVVPRTNILLPGNTCSPTTFRLPESYVTDAKVRKTQETQARLAESTAQLVELTNHWKEEYGPLPAALQTQLKTMHLHACTRRLGIDLVGLVVVDETDDGDKIVDCVLRSPGFRLRHLAAIVPGLPRKVLPAGLDVVFPARFAVSGMEQEIAGGQKVDWKALMSEESANEDREDEGWDAMDQEELEAMKDISSAVAVKDMDEVDLEQYPRFVLKNFGTSAAKGTDRLLKMLLPLSKIVYEKQAHEAEQAKAAAALREKQESMKNRKKANEALEAKRLGYRY